MKIKPWLMLLAFPLALNLAACGGDDDDDDANDDDVTGGPYDLTFTGESFDPHNGEVFGIAVVEKATGTVVASREISFEDGTFDETFEGVLEHGKAYYVDYFGDHSLNGSCAPPPADHTWRQDLGVITNHYQAGVVHNTNFTPEACDSF